MASDYAAKSLELPGGVPILKSSTEAFGMLASGAIDGSLMLGETPQSVNAIGLMDHYTIVPAGPRHDGAQGGGDLPRPGRHRHRGDGGCGPQIQTASGAFVAGLKQTLASIEDLWIEEARKAGVEDPCAVLDECRAAPRSPRPNERNRRGRPPFPIAPADPSAPVYRSDFCLGADRCGSEFIRIPPDAGASPGLRTPRDRRPGLAPASAQPGAVGGTECARLRHFSVKLDRDCRMPGTL